MKNLLVYSASETSKQSTLAAKYIEEFKLHEEINPQDFIVFNKEKWTYDFKVVAMYPHTYASEGEKSVAVMKVTQAQEDFIKSLPNAIEILAECDNNPDSEYNWESPSGEAKFLSVVGETFLTGDDTGEYPIAPRKKLAILA